MDCENVISCSCKFWRKILLVIRKCGFSHLVSSFLNMGEIILIFFSVHVFATLLAKRTSCYSLVITYYFLVPLFIYHPSFKNFSIFFFQKCISDLYWTYLRYIMSQRIQFSQISLSQIWYFRSWFYLLIH